MSKKELFVNLADILSEDQMDAVLNFVTVFADRSVLAKIESNALRSDPNPKTYGSFKEFMDEMELEENE